MQNRFYKIDGERKKDLLRYIILFISDVTPFLIPLIKIGRTCLVRDWGYFNTLSLVVHSSVWHYHVFPIHNPWALGGVDVLANPQSRVFSPLGIYDIVFTAPYANLFALITLGIVGSFGFYKLMRHVNITKNIAVAGSIVFIHASWFTLHFSEGHIVFGSFMLIGLAFYYILRIQEKNFKIYYALLNAFYLLDGAIYAFIFTNLLLVFAIVVCTNQLRPGRFVRSLFTQWKTTLISLFIFISLSSAKLIPFLMQQKSRTPVLEFVRFPFIYLFHCLFDPFQDIMKEVDGITLPFKFHEIGVYMGAVALLLIAVFLVVTRKRKFIPYMLIAIFFFWVGSGWFSPINPWHLFQKIPVVNNAHVQSRLFIISYLIFAVLLCFALDYFKTRLRPVFFYPIIIFLIVESLFVSSYPFYRVFSFDDSTCRTDMFSKMITSDNIDKTVARASVDWGFDFRHYFDKNTGAKDSGEPAPVHGDIKSVDDSTYKGEIYLTKGRGKAVMESYTPGKIHIRYALDTLSEIQLNTNYLLGWKTNDTDLKVYDKAGLLTIIPDNLTGEADILYRPSYLYVIFPLFLMGLIVTVIMLIKRK